MTATIETDDPFARPDNSAPADADDLIRNGRYYLPDPDGGPKNRYFTRATTWAKTIADTYRLNMWGVRMAIKGVTMDEGLYAAVASTSIDDRKALDSLGEQAKEVAGAKTRATLGTAVHAFADQIDRGLITLDDIPKAWREDVSAYVEALKALGLVVERHPYLPGELLSEVTVYEPTYEIVGTLDRIVRATRDLLVEMPDGRKIPVRKGDLLIFDLKTGRSIEYGTQEFSIQFAVYANATTIFDKSTREWLGPMPEVRKDVALACHVPVGEKTATVIGIDIEQGWKACWLIRQVRSWRNTKGLAAPILVIETSEEARARSAEWSEKVALVTRMPVLERLVIQMKRAGAYTSDLEEIVRKRAAEIAADTVAG